MRLGKTCGETLTDLQILGCELHQNVFGAGLHPDPLGEIQRSPSPSSRYYGRKGKGKEKVGNREEGEERLRKG